MLLALLHPAKRSPAVGGGRFLTPARLAAVALLASLLAEAAAPPPPVSFNREVRPILSDKCFNCHGPDPESRKADLRLDTLEGASRDLGGHAAIVKGKPDASELIKRIVTTDEDDLMPPPKSGKKLTPAQIETLKRWILQGAPYEQHWSFQPPARPALPRVKLKTWPRNPVDHFILARLEQEKLAPSPEADRAILARRVALDLTGLPPAPEELAQHLADRSPDAYEKWVDRLLASPAYGEHWARLWLDLARYADSAGYADDPPRKIWAFRDYVIQAFNRNLPFDQFTIEQLAGDLLDAPTEEQMKATAFHRNTPTNNEGGTNDEEFRNVAVVDRVNTTMSVWMGLSMACAQCHTHKYDPFTQKEYFQLFAFFNNTADADRPDEAPVLEFYAPEKREQRRKLEAELAALEAQFKTPAPEVRVGAERWDREFPRDLNWQTLRPADAPEGVTVKADGQVLARAGAAVAELQWDAAGAGRLQALRIEALPDDSLPQRGPGAASNGLFVLSRVTAAVLPPGAASAQGRYVRIEVPGDNRLLALAEVEVWSGPTNLARRGVARQSSTDHDGAAALAIDGNPNGDYFQAKSTTHTRTEKDPWWEVDLQASHAIEQVRLWNRTDGNTGSRLKNFKVSVLDADRAVVWSQTVSNPPQPSLALRADGARVARFTLADASAARNGYSATALIEGGAAKEKGWSVPAGKAATLVLVAEPALELPPGARLRVTLAIPDGKAAALPASYRLSVSAQSGAAAHYRVPAAVREALLRPEAERSEAQRTAVLDHYARQIAPELNGPRTHLAAVQKELAAIKPDSVPVLRELAADKQRVTKVHLRGNYLNLGDTVAAAVPEALHPLPTTGATNRLALARWLVDPRNPLTGRVVANRYWEQIFGIGLVRTSEEFGMQGELPSHPELLDWLASELPATGWDLKRLLRTLVTSATYRQSSRVTPELLERDPDNRLLARGPRHRLPAETVRDQALALSGLLSRKMSGPSVRPPQPAFGLSAAFGGSVDWQTSSGEDRYRRALYTEWRRSNPYPSMVTFDAPNREVCTLRRTRSNTPLQALVTLNDPVYIEAAQALARRLVREGGATAESRATHGWRLCLGRDPKVPELARLVKLFEAARASLAANPAKAAELAANPLGPLPAGADAVELAAWTAVANVLLNLDELLMKP